MAEPAAPSGPAPSVRDLIQRLSRVRRRMKRVMGTLAIARWTLGTLAILAGFFLADRLLDLPLGVRRFVRLGLLDRPEGLDAPLWVFLLAVAVVLALLTTRRGHGLAPLFAFVAAGVGGLLLWLAARLFWPLGTPLRDQDLALTVERSFRHLNDRLAAALDFEREVAHPTRGESVPMMGSVIQEAARETEGLEFTRVVSGRRAARWTLGALAGVALAALVALLMPDALGLWAQRSLLARDLSWPQATVLEAVLLEPDGSLVAKDPSAPYPVAVGRSLVVHARAVGDVPDSVLFVDMAEGAEAFRRRMSPVPDRKGLFKVEVHDVRRPFEFAIRGGDDLDDRPRYRVEVVVPPQVLEVRTHVEFPGYLSRGAQDVDGGNLAVPEGSKVTVSFRPDLPVEDARAVVGDEEVPATAVAGAPGRYAFTFEPRATTRYRIAIRATGGEENDPGRDSYEVRVEPDRAPRVEWVFPRGPVETTPLGRVPLLARTVDDHAVTALRLEVRLTGGQVLTLPLAARPPEGAPEGTPEDEEAAPAGGEGPGPAPLPANDVAYGRPVLRSYVALEVRDLLDAQGNPPTPPSRLAARVVARDSKGQEKEGAWTPVDVYRPADLERTISSRRASVRTEVQSLLAEQEERRKAAVEILAGPIGPAEKDHLRTLQFAQAKIAQDADRVVGSLLDLFTDYVYGRLGAEGPNEKILAAFDRHHRTTYGVEATPGGAAGSPPPHRGDPMFPYALFDEVVRAWRTRVIYDTAILDRMLRVVADAVDAAARLAPAAHEATTAAAGGGEAEVRAAVAAEEAVVAALQRVLESMRGWQNLNDVVILLRRIVEEQEALNGRIVKPEAEDK